jgi:hypothetical protein
MKTYNNMNARCMYFLETGEAIRIIDSGPMFQNHYIDQRPEILASAIKTGWRHIGFLSDGKTPVVAKKPADEVVQSILRAVASIKGIEAASITVGQRYREQRILRWVGEDIYIADPIQDPRSQFAKGEDWFWQNANETAM